MSTLFPLGLYSLRILQHKCYSSTGVNVWWLEHTVCARADRWLKYDLCMANQYGLAKRVSQIGLASKKYDSSSAVSVVYGYEKKTARPL